MERAIEACKAAGRISAQWDGTLTGSAMARLVPAADKLAEQLQSTKFFAPELPVINNVDVSAESDPDSIRGALVRQLHSPVRWSETVRALAADGVSTLYECGPGKVLCGLTKRIDRGLDAKPLENDAAFQNALTGA